MKAATRWVVSLALLAAPFACSKPPASPVVATYDGGQITAKDIDQVILALPPQQRAPEDGDLLAWYERIARDLAVQRLLLAEARKTGLDKEPEAARAREEAHRLAVVAVFVERDLEVTPPTAAEQQAYFDAHRAELETPGARQTFHLFRRLRPGADRRAVVAEVERLRARVLAGEDFQKLASEYSESESRHEKGLLGWVTRGSVPPALERVIFALEPGVPSQPLTTREGVHLFLVTSATEERTYTFPEVRARIARRMALDRRDAALTRRVGSTVPKGSFVPDAEALSRLLEAGDPEAVVLRVGDFRVTLADLRRRLLLAMDQSDGEAVQPLALLEALKQRELVYRYCIAHRLDRRPEVDERVAQIVDAELAALQARKRLMRRLDDDPRRLEKYYEENRGRFSEPLKLRLQRLTVPFGENANAVMARLEAARPDLDRGRQTLAGLATELGGKVAEEGWLTLPQLAQGSGGRAAHLALDLTPGQHSAPYHTASGIEVIRLLERRDPTPLPFDQVRERVRAELLASHGSEERAALVGEVLDAAHFKVRPAQLEAMLRRSPEES